MSFIMMVVAKIFAAIKFYSLKYLIKGIRISAVAPSFISMTSKVSLSGPRATIHMMGRVRFERDTELESRGELILGNNVILNRYSRIIAHERIRIGSDVLIARFVSILDHDHAFIMQNGTMRHAGYVSDPVVIGNNVWIGDKVSILKGVTIGDNVIIGANSVVSRDIPSNCIAAGSPAKPVKTINEGGNLL